jgi:tRNA (guanine37-N1)-methyltransferase
VKITVFTIFPEIVEGFCSKSLLGKALEGGLWNLNIVNPRDYSEDKHGRVDDTPYGGGHGMVMRPDILGNSIEANCSLGKTKIIYMSPRGNVLNQEKIRNLLKYEDLSIICGRYEGIDERVIEEYNIEEISIGDFVIMGGELPALMLIEGLIRCVDNVVGDKESITEDSFGGATNNIFNDLLEYPLYTRPPIWKNRQVPDVLLSGHHENIRKWKIEMAKKVTENRKTPSTVPEVIASLLLILLNSHGH